MMRPIFRCAPGSLIAEDGSAQYLVGEEPSTSCFPTPGLKSVNEQGLCCENLEAGKSGQL